jgi:hypothetical protein
VPEEVRSDSAAAKGFTITGVQVPRDTITSEITPDGNGGYTVKLNNVVPTNELNGADVLLKTDLKDTRLRVFVVTRRRGRQRQATWPLRGYRHDYVVALLDAGESRMRLGFGHGGMRYAGGAGSAVGAVHPPDRHVRAG